jgi:acyl-coenzyme A synthetase/AMP-(fatty) acid ligase
MACVVLKEDRVGTPELVTELQDFAVERLAPNYYKKPRRIEFVAALPKTATGKIQRYLVRKMLDERVQADAPVATA